MPATYLGASSADREALEELHRVDAEASMRQDHAILLSLMSDDPVILPPGARPLRGREQVEASFARQQTTPLTVEVLSYAFEWQEVEVIGDLAIEWGRIVGETRPRDAGPEVPSTAAAYNVLRVLRRQPDGWKVHRTIWNPAAPA
jgi:ketosteroid isomerase-like protein